VFQYFIPFTFAEIENSLRGKKFVQNRKQEYLPGGWVATQVGKPNPESALKEYSTRFTNNQVLPSNFNRLLDKVETWKKQNVKVFAFRPPTTYKMVALEDSLSAFNEDSIRLGLENVGAIWLDFPVDKYESFDGSHLDKENAIKFSIDLANKIKNRSND
jgi:hypothetical protein